VKGLEVREIPRPDPKPHELLVRVAAVGICGTDFHIYSGEANYNTDECGRPLPLAQHPQILGHEITGQVVAAGPEVTDVHEGDHVVLDQGLNCLSARRASLCEYCATGDSHQCEFYREYGITGLPGGLAEFITIPAVNAVRIESDIEPTLAALSEPLACVSHSMSSVADVSSARYQLNAQAQEQRVRTVLILGAGPAGLLFVQCLRRVLAFDGLLLVSEPNAHKRALAARFGAEVVDPTCEDLAEVVRERTGGRLAEFVIESSGSGRVFVVLPTLLRKQGTVLLYSHGHGGADMSLLNRLQFKEPVLVCPLGASGAFDSDGRSLAYRRSLRLLEQCVIDVSPLVSHRYRALADVERAFGQEFLQPDYVKGVVQLA
jgi:L-iditol 2-dehydrogenase